jgi:hypothetical protein
MFIFIQRKLNNKFKQFCIYNKIKCLIIKERKIVLFCLYLHLKSITIVIKFGDIKKFNLHYHKRFNRNYYISIIKDIIIFFQLKYKKIK